MIRKILISSLILIVTAFITNYQFGIFESYNWITANRDISKKEIRLIIYGELDPYEQLRNKAANELGFEYFRPTGCTVDQPFINGVSVYNRLVIEFLNEQHPNWVQQVNERFEQLIALEKPPILTQ